jgi:chromosome partitioning protein
MVKPRTALNEEIKGLLKEYNVPIFNATLSERVGYIRSFVTSGVFNTDDVKAQEEVLLLADEILDKLNN